MPPLSVSPALVRSDESSNGRWNARFVGTPLFQPPLTGTGWY